MPVPVLLITGYLGAGKTTLVNHLLSDPAWSRKKLAIVINEFSSIGVDGKLLVPGSYTSFEINRGSLFCTCTRTDLLNAMQKIATMDLDAVIIEATGIAQPADLEDCLDLPPIAGKFRVHANLCLVDAVTFPTIAATLRPAAVQVQCADAIVINKIDRVGASDLAKLKELLAALNPHCPVIAVSLAAIPADFPDRLTHARHDLPQPVRPPADIVSISFTANYPVDRDRFIGMIRSLGPRLLRLKGNVEFTGSRRFIELAGDELVERSPVDHLGNGTMISAIAWGLAKSDLESRIRSAWEGSSSC